MKVILWVQVEDLGRLEAGEQVEAKAAMENPLDWVQVLVDSAEYRLERNRALFGSRYLLQKKA